MRKLKLFFACLLMAVLSIGQVWATPSTYTWTLASGDLGSSGSPSSSVTKGSPSTTWATSYTWGGSGATKYLGWDGNSSAKGVQIGTGNATNKCASLVLSTSGISGTISAVSINTSGASSVSATVGVSVGSTTFKYNNQNTASLTSSANSYSFTGSATGEIRITWTNSSAKAIYIKSISVTYEAGGASTPTVTVSPTSWDFETVHASDAASKVFSVSGSNLTAGQNLSIAVPDGYSVSPNSITVSAATLNATNVTVSKNTTAVGSYNGNMSISGGGQTSAKTVGLSMTVDADPAPTGTFKLFSGDIVEGDYVIVSTNALSNTVNSNRIASQAVTISDNKIVNPNAAVVWHIAASGDYWTLYNADAEKYAGGTTTKNQGALLASVTDYAKWTITGSSTYEFENLGRATGSSDTGNKWLRYNSGNAENSRWACYGTGTGSAVTLYKLDDGKPAAPTFSPAAGSFLEAQSVTISAVDGASIYYTTDGSTTPTTSSTPYTGAINVSTTTTIKAIAVKDAVSSNVASATYTIVEPLSVTAAIALIPNANDQVNDQYVEGFVCTAGTSVSSGKMTYYISADGSETNRLQIYKGKNLSDTEFTNVNNLAIGDKVVVYGQLKNFSGTKEMNDGNYIVRRTAKGALSSVVVSGTPTKTAYSADEAFETAGLVVTATYESGYAVTVTPDSWAADPATVTVESDINVTATYGGETSDAYPVHVTIVAATLDHISLSYDAVEVYQGKPLPKPVVTAHWSDASTSDVTALASFTGYDKDTPGDQTITVSYQFGTGDPEEATYTVTVKPIYNVELAASVAKDLIETVVGNAESTSDMIVRGKVSSVGSISSKCLTYFISDDGTTTNHLEIFKGKYLDNADFTDGNKLKVGDEVVVTGKVIYYNNNTAEFANGKSQVTSLARTPNFSITDVASFEVGSADLAVADLTINVEGEGAVTFASSDNTNAVTIVDGKLHAVAAGTATITANLAANGIYKAATAEFNVTVIPATIKYAITFDGNGGSGDAPEFAAEAAAGAEVTLPANSYTYTGHNFTGWKVYDENEDEVTVTAGVFEMPASPVTIKAQWEEISAWAYVYSSNVELETDDNDTKAYKEKVKITVEETLTEFDALRAATGSAAGLCHVIVPAGTQKLHFHAAAWNGKSSTVTVKMGETTLLSQALTSDVGIANTSPYTLSGNAYEYYYSIDLSSYSLTEDTRITFSAGSDKRFVLFGVNQEGGSVPVLDHIEITGTMTNTTGWKTGDNIIPEGLTVTAYYTQNDAPHHNTEVTDDVTWSHAALVENQTEVTLTASYTDGVEKTANTNVTIDAVETGDPTIITDPSTQATFTATERGAALPAAKTIAVTLKNITSATATLGGTNPEVFSLSKTSAIVDGDVISVSVESTDIEVASYSATVTIKDANGDTQKSINIYLTIKQPEAVETPVSTSTKWVPATAITNGMQVLITGAIDDDIYAMGAQGGNNRTAVKGSVDGDVFTPSNGTMAFTLIAQEGGTYAIQTSAGKYLYAGASSNNRLFTRDAIGDDNNANWTVAIEALAANGSNRGVMQFNSGLFNCYASASQSPIKLYVQAYTVTFNSNEGSAVDPVNVAHGQTVAQPANPTKDNYTFVKWQLNGEDYNFATPVTADITLDAVWTPVMYTVTFNSNGGSDVASANVAYGETVAEPTAPTKDNYNFVEWQLNGVAYDFTAAVTASITLDAVWEPVTPPTPDYETVRNGLEINRYYTVCLPKKVTAIKGASFWTLKTKSQDGATAYLEEETELPFAAGKPFIIQATAENLEVVYEGAATEDAGTNGALHGTLVYMNAAALTAAGTDVYMLFSNELRPVGENNHLDANRAYVLLSELNPVAEAPKSAPGKRVRAMPMQPQVATGMDALNASDAPAKVLINGQLFIIRGEKMFDAKGQLVK